MNRRHVSVLLLAAACGQGVGVQAATAGSPTMTETEATGLFEVKMTPLGAADAPVGGFALDKTYHGPLEAVSVGQMLAVRAAVEGSAGYVAMERVTGTLDGRLGTFALQHSGTMDRGAASLTIAVVPDSGTGALTGISGTMTITVADGKHQYGFRYSLPD
jgi:hypothetical protein